MSKILIENIAELVGVHQPEKAMCGVEMKNVPTLKNAWLSIENEQILNFGNMENLPSKDNFDEIIDATNKSVLPTWIDSHTHSVFAKTRETEFVDRINGLTYEDIAARGGGILNSAKAMAQISEEELYELALENLKEAVQWGTGYIEIKSGYGLNVENELKMLRVIKKLKAFNLLPIKATFLGAHAYPMAFKDNHKGYLDLIVNEMLPQIANEGLADYIDVFCERGFFNVEESEYVIKAGIKHGLIPKIHANQLYNSGGVQLGVKYNALSVDHLETIDDAEIACLKNSNTMATLLPGAAFFLGMHYQPARTMIDHGLAVSIASDFNPGSCPSVNIPFMMSLACTQMKMTPEEALNAVTINAAASINELKNYGSIAIGKKANILITKPIASYYVIPYKYASNNVETVFIHGKKIV